MAHAQWYAQETAGSFFAVLRCLLLFLVVFAVLRFFS